MFVTLFVGILDVTSGRLIYVNGGHNWPLLAREGERFEVVKVTGGMLLGICPEARYTSSELLLKTNDTLVLYTDGVTEAERTRGEFFTLDGVREYLDSIDRDATAKAIATGLQEAVFAFSNSDVRSDDITILVLRLLP
jgi:sigma-B regulation protein RsbU (phosphoserine phosphatase)